MGLGKTANGRITKTGNVSVLPTKGERTKALESKVGQIEGRQQEGMFHPRDHEAGGRFCRDDVDVREPGQRSAGRWVL